MNKFFIRKEAGLVKEADYKQNALRRIFGSGPLLKNAWNAWSRYLNTTKRYARRQFNNLSNVLNPNNAAAISPDNIRSAMENLGVNILQPDAGKSAWWDALTAKGRLAYDRGANFLLDDFYKLKAQIPGKFTGLFKNPATTFSIPAKMKALSTKAKNLNNANLVLETPLGINGGHVLDNTLPHFSISKKFGIDLTPGLVHRSDFDHVFKGGPRTSHVAQGPFPKTPRQDQEYINAGKALKKEYNDIYVRRNGFQRPE